MAYDRAALLAQLKIDEGTRLHPYTDTTGNLTIGIGRNLSSVGISETEAEALCLNDMAAAEAALTRNVPWWLNLDDARQMALINLTFNMGINTLLEFKNMLAALHAGDYSGAAVDLLASKYAKEVGARAERIAALIRGGNQ
jgi:lysozyme